MDQSFAEIVDLAGYVILGLFVLTMLISVLFGLKRGFGKSLVRLITVIASFAVSYLVATSAMGMLEPLWKGKTLLELIDTVPGATASLTAEMSNLLASYDAEAMMPLVSLALSLVVLPILFVVVFYLIKFISLLIFFILSGILGLMKKKKNGLSRLLGAAIGAVQGLVIFAVIMTPIVGILSVPDALRGPLTDESLPAETVEAAEELYSYVEPVVNDPVISAFSRLGVKKVYDGIARVKVRDTSYRATDELSRLGYLYVEAMPLFGMDFTHPTPENEEAIRGLLASVGEDPFLSELISGALRGTASAFNNGALVFPMGAPFDTLCKEMIAVFEDVEADNYHRDLETLLNVYFILAEHGVVSLKATDGNAIADVLVKEIDGQNAIDRVVNELKSNPHTKHLVSALTKLSVTIMCDNLNLGEEAEQIYSEVKSGIADALSISKHQFATEEEYKEEVSQSLDNTLKSNGIEVEDEVLQEMTNYISDNSESLGGMTDEDIDAVILSYYSGYAEYLKNNPDGSPDDFIDGIDPDQIPGLDDSVEGDQQPEPDGENE